MISTWIFIQWLGLIRANMTIFAPPPAYVYFLTQQHWLSSTDKIHIIDLCNMLLWLLIILTLLCSFIFTKTTKGIPKSWFEWKTEFRYQYLGIVGLIHDAQYASRDRVGMYIYNYLNLLLQLLSINNIFNWLLFSLAALYKQPDRIAVITGGNRGIGLRIVEKLLACDMTVIMGEWMDILVLDQLNFVW